MLLLGGFVLVGGGAALAAECAGYGPAGTVTEVTGPTESSGLALGSDGETWFTLDDSGGAPQLFAFTLASSASVAVPLDGPTQTDWEALAAGPCPQGAGRCLFIGDVGDNLAERETVTVWVVEEPVGDVASGFDTPALVAEWTLQWPQGSQDSEALAVHPCTGQVFLVAKTSSAPVGLYAVPEGAGDETVELEHVADLELKGYGTFATGAAWDEDGGRFVVRTYLGAHEWAAEPGCPERTWNADPLPIDLDIAGQGEAIAYGADGALVTTDEGAPMRVAVHPCTDLTQAGTCGDDCPPGDTAEDTGGTTPTSTPPAAEGCCGSQSGTAQGAVAALIPLWGLILRRRRGAATRSG